MPQFVFPTQEQWDVLRELGLTERSHDKVLVRPDVQEDLLTAGYAPDNLPEVLPEGYVVGEDPDVSLEIFFSPRHILIDHLDLE